MSGCRETLPKLTEFVGGDLLGAEFDRVRTHLIDCVTCRREAASLQRASGALRSVADAAVPGVDDAMFTGLHRSIVAAVHAAEPAPARSAMWLAAAALVLLVGGLALGMAFRRADSVWTRPPVVTMASQSLVVPWAGPRVDLQLLGDEQTDPWGGGLLEKYRLRQLADEGVLLPVPTAPR
jgi:anti-sigma factor RsiW